MKRFLNNLKFKSKILFIVGALFFVTATVGGITYYHYAAQDVEKNLCALPGVDQAVVVCREAADGRALRLIAFVIPKQEDPPTRAEIQALLAHRLPDYMRPSIQLIKNFPLTENGKCDRKRLKEIANGRSDFEIDSGYRK